LCRCVDRHLELTDLPVVLDPPQFGQHSAQFGVGADDQCVQQRFDAVCRLHDRVVAAQRGRQFLDRPALDLQRGRPFA
jgi:hypothetical protein